MSFKLSSPDFWSKDALDKERRRELYVCHTCRLCFNLCPYFPAFFDKIDGVDGDLKQLDYEALTDLTELCYQCKLCFVRCPYTPPHEFAIDIPRLLLRAKAVEGRRRGVPLRDRLLGDTNRLGGLGKRTSRLANWVHKNKFMRGLMHDSLGIHRDRLLPIYHGKTFEEQYAAWRKNTAQLLSTKSKGKVALFYTCFVNYNYPSIGMAAVDVLHRNGVEVVCPSQKCCGMPFLDGGQLDHALENAAFNVRSLASFVKEGYDVVVLGPTCGYVLRTEYPTMLEMGEDVKLIRQRTSDICEYLVRLHKAGQLNTTFSWSPGKMAYHMPCHHKAQGVGYRSLELLKLIPGAEVQFIDKGCSGMDGTWGFKREFFELSLKVGSGLIKGVKDAQPAFPVTDCPMAALQIEQGTGLKPLHPVEVLQKAYG
ncbi:MAG: anaerobic glycerol-3-phosphate dehydrogenase subunit C, partial [Candidatus Bathyarchaeia archaeon]